MSAGVTTTHDKYPPFTRAELQQLRDRAAWIGAQLIDPHAARAHLDLAQAADHMDAILARAELKPDLKLYDPNADTELYVPPAPDGHLDGAKGRAMPAPEVLSKPPLGVYPSFLWWEEHPTPSAAERESRRRDILAAIERRKGTTFEPLPEWFAELELLKSADARPDLSESAGPNEKSQALRGALADQRTGAWAAVREPDADSPGIFQRLGERTRGLIVDRIARRNGAKHAAVEAALTEVTRDRPLWQWLRDGGLERLIALVVSLLPLFV